MLDTVCTYSVIIILLQAFQLIVGHLFCDTSILHLTAAVHPYLLTTEVLQGRPSCLLTTQNSTLTLALGSFGATVEKAIEATLPGVPSLWLQWPILSVGRKWPGQLWPHPLKGWYRSFSKTSSCTGPAATLQRHMKYSDICSKAKWPGSELHLFA